MQATQQHSNHSNIVTVLSDSFRILAAVGGSAVIVAAVLEFQQFLIQVYALGWQMALLFTLLGLMVALLAGQYLFKPAGSGALSSLIVTLFGFGIIVCILSTPAPFI